MILIKNVVSQLDGISKISRLLYVYSHVTRKQSYRIPGHYQKDFLDFFSIILLDLVTAQSPCGCL